MPYNPNFTGRKPKDTYGYLINTDGTNIYESGTGSQLVYLNVTASHATHSISSSIAIYADTASFATSASYEVMVEMFSSASLSSSWASASISASHSQTTNLAYSAISSSYASLAYLSQNVEGLTIENVDPSLTTVYPGTINQIVTLSSSLNNPHVSVKYGGKLYGGCWSGNYYVINDPDNDLTNITSASINDISPELISAGVAHVFNGTASIFYTSNYKIWKMDVDNFTSASVLYAGSPIPMGNDVTSLPPIAASGSYLFVGTFPSSPPSYFLKIDIATGTVAQSQSWYDPTYPFYSGYIRTSHGVCISDDLQWLYFTSAGGAIAKVSTANLSNYTSSYIGTGVDWQVITDDVCYLNGKVYCASEDSATIFKFDATTMVSESATIGGFSYGCFTDGTHVYCGLTTSEVDHFWNGDLSQIRRFSLAGVPNEMWFTDGGKIITTAWSGPNLQWISLPITEVGINKVPSKTLDVAGDIRATNISASVITASTVTATTFNFSNIVDNNSGSTLDTPTRLTGTTLTTYFVSASSMLITASRVPSASGSNLLVVRGGNVLAPTSRSTFIIDATGSMYGSGSLFGTSSWANSASWAASAYGAQVVASASWASSSYYGEVVASSSWASSSYRAQVVLSSSWASSSYYGEVVASASWASSSYRAQVVISSSWASASISSSQTISSSYADTASWATNAINGGTQIPSASYWNITASRADTASYFFSNSGSGAWRIYVDMTSGDLVWNYA